MFEESWGSREPRQARADRARVDNKKRLAPCFCLDARFFNVTAFYLRVLVQQTFKAAASHKSARNQPLLLRKC